MRKQPLFEEKSKIVFSGSEPGTLIQYFKDEPVAAAVEGKTPVLNFAGRGVINNQISEFLHHCLQESGIPTYFLKRLSRHEQLVADVDLWPVEVSVRNIVTKEFAEIFDFKEGERLEQPLLEYHYITTKNEKRLISAGHLTMFSWACTQDVEEINKLALRANDFLSGVFAGAGMHLAEFKVRFGCFWDEEDVKIILADELSSETCEAVKFKNPKDKTGDSGLVYINYHDMAQQLGIIG